MTEQSIAAVLACPDCRTRLPLEPHHCPGCGQDFPVYLGIADLRPADQRAQPLDPASERLLAAFPRASSKELFALRLEGMELHPYHQETVVSYADGAVGRTRQMIEMFWRRAESSGLPIPPGAALDIGCGTGAALLAMRRRFDTVWGMEIDLPSLIVARKLLDEHGARNVALVQGDGRRLPFADGSFSYINALNVLEHVFAPDRVLAEAARALALGGVFSGDSRNRYDLLFKEPHTGLRYVGWLPRALMPRYVAWRRGMRYDYVHLLSLLDLQRAAAGSFGDQFQVRLPDVRAYTRAPGAAVALLSLIDRVLPLRQALLAFFPTHLLLARKSA